MTHSIDKKKDSVADNASCALLDANPEPVFIINADGTIRDVNGAAQVLFGKKVSRLTGMPFANCFDQAEEAEAFLRLVFQGKKPVSRTLAASIHSKCGTDVMCTSSLFRCCRGKGMRAYVVIRDMTDVRKIEAQLVYHSTRDSLTSLLNRASMLNWIEQSIGRFEERGGMICLILLDLNNFKDINEAFGHATGDSVLKYVAMRLLSVVDDRFAVGRISGNEFAVAGEGFEDIHQVHQLAEKLLKSVAEPIQVHEHEIVITSCIGITLFPLDGYDAAAMLRDASTAMHQAKQNSSSHIRYFTAEMNRKVRRRMEIGNCLRHALSDDELELYYQPRFDLLSESIVGFEALLRWDSSSLNRVAPDEFIPVAEQTGLIVPIGEWVLLHACRQVVEWEKRYGFCVKVAVNISARQFSDTDLIKIVAKALEQTGAKAKFLEFELTESMLMHNTKRVMLTLSALKDLGVSLAVDDFGTGYSSLNYLKQFPLDYLKIDRSFVADIPGSESDEAIVKAIIGMAKSLGLKVIAEGVETQQQLAFLKELSCDEIQGFLIAKPMPACKVNEMVRQPGFFASPTCNVSASCQA